MKKKNRGKGRGIPIDHVQADNVGTADESESSAAVKRNEQNNIPQWDEKENNKTPNFTSAPPKSAEVPLIVHGVPHLPLSFKKKEPDGKENNQLGSFLNTTNGIPSGVSLGSSNATMHMNFQNMPNANPYMANNEFNAEYPHVPVNNGSEFYPRQPIGNAPVLPFHQDVNLVNPTQLENETEKYYKEVGLNSSNVNAASGNTQHFMIPTNQETSITDQQQMSMEENEKVQASWTTLHQYWAHVQENPYDFDGWTCLLNHVETMNNIDAARSAFEGFLPLYPYCYAYWIKFSDLELKSSDQELAMGVLSLGSKCVPFCCELWTPLINKFLDYALTANIAEDTVRGLYELALDNVGMSWSSSSIWELYINYEMEKGDLVRVMNLYRRLLTVPTKLYNKHWEHFLALVREYHARNFLTIEEYSNLKKSACDTMKIKFNPPSLETPQTLLKVTQPEDKIHTLIKEKIVACMIPIHEANEKECDKRWKYEEKIKRPYFHVKPLEKKQLKTWREYLDFEIKEGDPVRTVSLFERCLVPCAMYEEFWCKYASYLENLVMGVLRGKYTNIKYKPGCFEEKTEESKTETKKSGNQTPTGDNNEADVESKEEKHKGTEKDNSDLCQDFWQARDQLEVTAEVKFQVNFLLNRLSGKTSVGGKVLTPPTLTPSNILQGLTWEDVRQVYRRGAWIHCPSKPHILMQWAEFEEGQENVQTARELLNTVLAKHSKLLKARLQLIDLERRNGEMDRVDELFAQTFKLYEDVQTRSFVAIKYARFLFKIREEDDNALLILRKVLKKDKGNIHLYHHVFDICFQRRPIDCNGVLASVMLALASKELSLDEKYYFCLKRLEFLKEHGTMVQLKEATAEMDEIKSRLDKGRPEDECDEAKNEGSDNATENNAEPAKTEAEKSHKHNTSPQEQQTSNDPNEPTIPPTLDSLIKAGRERTLDKTSRRSKRHHDDESPESRRHRKKSSRSSKRDSKKSKRSRRRDREEGEVNDEEDFNEDEEEVERHRRHRRDGGSFISEGPLAGLPLPHNVTPQQMQQLQMLQQLQQMQKAQQPNPGMPGNGPLPLTSPWRMPPPPIPNFGFGRPNEGRKNGQNAMFDQFYNMGKQNFGSQDQGLGSNSMQGNLGMEANRSYLPPPPAPQGILGDSLFTQGKMDNQHSFGNGQGSGTLPTDQFLQPPPLLNPMFGSNFPQPGLPNLSTMPPNFNPRFPGGPGMAPGNPSADGLHNMQHTTSKGVMEPLPGIPGINQDGQQQTSGPSTKDLDANKHAAGILGDYPGPRMEAASSRKPFAKKDGSSRSKSSKDFAQPNNVSIPKMRSGELMKGGKLPDWFIKEGGELRLSETSNGVSIIRYWPRYMNEEGHTTLFKSLRHSIKWHQKRYLSGIPPNNNWTTLPKLLYWVGPCSYEKDGFTLPANTSWPPEIVDLLHRLMTFTKNSFNSCMVSLYQSGHSHHSWHTEKHRALAKNPTTSSLSLGVTRMLEMKRTDDDSQYFRFPLFPGSLLMIEGATHQDWLSQIMKEPNIKSERICLSFRTMLMIKGVTV